jgi:integrase
MEPRNLWAQFKALSRKANLPDIRFHDLRHTASSLLLNHGVSPVVVSRRLGHANPSITLSIYAHATMDMQVHVANVMDQILGAEAITVSALHPVAPASEFRALKLPPYVAS